MGLLGAEDGGDRRSDAAPTCACAAAMPSIVDAPATADSRARLDRAVDGLGAWRPDLSAGTPTQVNRGFIAAVAAVVALVLLGVAGERLDAALAVLLAFPFFVSACVRLGALAPLIAAPRDAEPPTHRLPDDDLPPYTILVPLYREVGVAPQIVDAIAKLDYPVAKLQVLVVVEACDPETAAAVARYGLPRHMRLVVVPPGAPRTKPRALNYARAEATGDFLVVYDAEDVPEPDQLRRAVAAFARDPRIGCLQARLNIYEPDKNWLTRQFTMEYSSLFDALLPTIVRLGWPVPLGGTSNHFPRHVIEACGGWDSYNVTEDADLGVRLARFGWRVGVLASTTWEEAPATWRVWLGQRTRWVKGWMQTWLVHSRHPVRLLRDLGLWSFAGFQLWSAAVLVSALVHPWLFAMTLWHVGTGGLHAPTSGLWWLALFNLGAGYASAMALGRTAVARRKLPLGASAWTLPLYWIAISIAAHRALVELVTAPFHWEKTEHQGCPTGQSTSQT